VQKRPGVEKFLQEMSELYEIVIYTASLAKYAAPLIEKLDPLNYASHCLFRNHCSLLNNSFVKDLGLLGRDLGKTLIVDNSPTAYILQPDNGIPIQTWLGDINDKKLIELMPLLELLANINGDIRPTIRRIVKNGTINYDGAILSLKSEISNRKFVSKFVHPQPQLSINTEDTFLRGNTLPLEKKPEKDVIELEKVSKQIRAKAIPIHIRINQGNIEFHKTAEDKIKPNTAMDIRKNEGCSTIIAFVDNKPTNRKKEQLEAAIDKEKLLEYRLMPITTTVASSRQYSIKGNNFSPSIKTQSRLLMLPKEAEKLRFSQNSRQVPYRPTTSVCCVPTEEPSAKKYKSKRAPSLECLAKEASKSRISTASPREIMHQIRHVGALIKNNTIQSPICMTEKKNSSDIRIRYVVASAYDEH